MKQAHLTEFLSKNEIKSLLQIYTFYAETIGNLIRDKSSTVSRERERRATDAVLSPARHAGARSKATVASRAIGRRRQKDHRCG